MGNEESDPNWAIAEAHRISEQQGWSRYTVEALKQEFIDRTDPWGYRDFLRERADAENEGAAAMFEDSGYF